jgi:predicted NBD/HSP70 family sugar kinase
MTLVVFDIGGTNTRIAVSKDGETLQETISVKTKANFKDGIAALCDGVDKLVGTDKITGIAGGTRGVLDEAHTGIHNDGPLKGWIRKSITGALEERFGVMPILENDTAIAGLGEAVFGAGKGLSIVAYHTISTGVGGVKIEEGEIDMATVGFEPGHQVLDIDRTILGEEITPTLENLVSGTAVENRMGMKPYEVPQEDALWDELAEYLAQGLRNTILYWSPEAIVLGGSMITGDPRIQIDAIRKYTVAVLDGFVDCPFITMAKLGDEAGLYGALALLKRVS